MKIKTKEEVIDLSEYENYIIIARKNKTTYEPDLILSSDTVPAITLLLIEITKKKLTESIRQHAEDKYLEDIERNDRKLRDFEDNHLRAKLGVK